MRPLTLTISAFGPYPDEVTIPLQDLGEQGLYLICGDTGAGKTTIFDAISYALFGAASGAQDGSREPKMLRSDFADPSTDTFVDLTFSLRGETYRIRRNPEYARVKKRGTGTTQHPAAVEFHRPGKPALTKAKEVNAAVEGLLGINRNQFGQIVMIAQGEFRKLLTTTTKERAEVFRHLFDTSAYVKFQAALEAERVALERDYQDASRAIKDAAATALFAEGSERSLMRARHISEDSLSGMWLKAQLEEQIAEDDAQEATLTTNLAAIQNSINHANERLTTASNLAQARLQQERAQTDILSLEATLPALQQDVADAEANRPAMEQLSAEKIRLEGLLPSYDRQAQQQKELAHKHDVLTSARANHQAACDAITQLDESVASLETQLATFDDADAALVKAQHQEQATKDALEQLHSLLKAYRAVEELEHSARQASADHATAVTATKTAHDNLEATKSALADLEASVRLLADAPTVLLEAQAALKDLQVDTKAIDALLVALKQREEALDAATREAANAASAMDTATNRYKAAATTVTDLEVAQAAERAGLLAQNLQAGSPCPVCGSTHHPAPASLSESAPTEEALEAARAEAEHQQGLMNQASINAATTQTTLEAARTALNEFLDANGSKEALEKRKTELEGQMEPAVKAVANAQQRLKDQKTLADKTIPEARAKQASDQATYDEALKAEQALLLAENDLVARLQVKREALPDTTKDELVTRTSDAMIAYEQAQQATMDAISRTKQRDTLRQTLEDLKHRRSPALQQEQAAQAALDQARLDVSAVQATLDEITASLPHPTKEETQSVVTAIAAQHDAFKTAIDKAQRTLEETTGQLKSAQTVRATCEAQLKDAPVIDVEAEQAIREAALADLEAANQHRSDITYRLRTNRTTLAKTDEALQRSAGIDERYGAVAQLANAANGKLTGQARLAFETYVQGIYFDRIIAAANRRLKVLTSGRYELQRHAVGDNLKGQAGLDLDVIDHYTGRARNASSLSGGESFEASLCLALGLSDVVQATAGGIQLETMFIDEGFGSLDQEALNAAISMLSSLTNENKLIGIISHVEDLKDNIDRKIVVTKSQKGSKLELQL